MKWGRPNEKDIGSELTGKYKISVWTILHTPQIKECKVYLVLLYSQQIPVRKAMTGSWVSQVMALRAQAFNHSRQISEVSLFYSVSTITARDTQKNLSYKTKKQNNSYDSDQT